MPHRNPLLLTVALVGLFSAPALAQTRTPTHVACVGDSITYGYLASNQATKSYPADLQTIFGSSVMVKNFGRNSATLLSTGDLPWTTADNGAEYNAANTFVSGAGSGAVVDVIIMLGTNDSKSYNWMTSDGGTHAAQYAIDLAALVDHFTGLSTHPVVYLALPAAIYTNSFGISESVTHNEIAPIIMQVAAQKGMPVIDVHTPTSGHPEYFQDGVHPTDAGYMLLAQIMHDGLLAGGGGTGGRGGSGGAGGAGGRGGSGGGAGSGGAGGGAAGRGGAAGGGAGRGGTGGAAGGGAGRGGNGGSGGSGAGGTTGGTGGTTAGTGGTTAGAGGTSAGAGRGGAGGATSGAAGATGGSIGGSAAGGSGAGGSGAGGSAGGVGTGGASTGTGGVGAAGGGGATIGGNGGDGGCGCRLGDGPGSGFAAFGLLLIALARRRAR